MNPVAFKGILSENVMYLFMHTVVASKHVDCFSIYEKKCLDPRGHVFPKHYQIVDLVPSVPLVTLMYRESAYIHFYIWRRTREFELH